VEERLKTLEGQLIKDSSTSSQPSSSDGFKRTPNSLRTVSRRPSGGQPSHPGKTLRQVEVLARVVVCRSRPCPHCGLALDEAEACPHECRQVFDLPSEIKPEVVENTVRKSSAVRVVVPSQRSVSPWR
jgi:transposase